MFAHVRLRLRSSPRFAQCTALFHSAVTRRCVWRGMLLIPRMIHISTSRAFMCVGSVLCGVVCPFAALIAIAGSAVRLHALLKSRPYGTNTSPPAGMFFFASIDTQCMPVTVQRLTFVAIFALFLLPPSFAYRPRCCLYGSASRNWFAFARTMYCAPAFRRVSASFLSMSSP